MATNHVQLAPHQVKNYVRRIGKHTALGMAYGRGVAGVWFYPTPRFLKKDRKKPGQPRRYLLWDRGVFIGAFASKRERRAFIEATLTLESKNGD